MRVVSVRGLVHDVDSIRDLRMRRTVDGLAFVPVMHVAIAADGRVGGPLVSWNAHEPARHVEHACEVVQSAPECACDLEVVALVPHHVDVGLVAPEGEVLMRRIRTERLVRLAVRVTPRSGRGLRPHR